MGKIMICAALLKAKNKMRKICRDNPGPFIRVNLEKWRRCATRVAWSIAFRPFEIAAQTAAPSVPETH
jgi:hypothetical protein